MMAFKNNGQESIFSLFTKSRELLFSDIQKATGIRSNLLSYHLQALMKDGMLKKEGEYYKVDEAAESLLPKLNQLSGNEKGPLAIVTAAIVNGDKICLLKRAKRPYQNYWGLIGGKIKLHESLEETALREALEETGVSCRFEKVGCVLHERVREDGVFKHCFVIFACRLSTEEQALKPSEEGELAWFDLRSLPKNIIPSDRIMIDCLSRGDCSFKQVIMDEKQDSIRGIQEL